MLSAQDIEWHFNPSSAPHMGGVWKRLVQNVKQYLAVVLVSQVLTDEVLNTAFTEVEFIVNSRPLISREHGPDRRVGANPKPLLAVSCIAALGPLLCR